ncbi:MAG: hypothetical protein AAB907_01635 [Patescibacteria group bacterium]
MIDKLAICKQTRKVSSDSLLRTLTKALGTNDPISESQFRDFWLSELRTHKELFPDGWYTPPPHGIGVLFGNGSNFMRTNHRSLRPEENWPKSDIFWTKKMEWHTFLQDP